MTTPNQATVRHDDPNDLKAPPRRVTSAQSRCSRLVTRACPGFQSTGSSKSSSRIISTLTDTRLRVIADQAASASVSDAIGQRREERVGLGVDPEGGWNDFERRLLQDHGFQPVGMGPRTLSKTGEHGRALSDKGSSVNSLSPHRLNAGLMQAIL
jgi:RNA methyltransferase